MVGRAVTAKKVTFIDFKGILAPVFTCFEDEDGLVLNLEPIDAYAAWLKEKNVCGVMVNSISGEGPALSVQERIQNAETWWKAAKKHKLLLVLQIGGAPLPDVIMMARHAESIGVDAVCCLPELLYKPQNINELIGYCKLISKYCSTRPFLYYHFPKYTNVNFNMVEFCEKAEEEIPQFYGMQYSSSDLEVGAACLKHGRVVLFGASTMIASALFVGFDSVLVTAVNTVPTLCYKVYSSMKSDNIDLAKKVQKEINTNIFKEVSNSHISWIGGMKNWFNAEMVRADCPTIYVGPARIFRRN